MKVILTKDKNNLEIPHHITGPLPTLRILVIRK